MASLSTHLRRPDDHGRLAFHPECPLCRCERLAGALPAKAVVSRRAQAALAAGVLALSSVTPAAVLAAEPGKQQDGVAGSEQVAAVPVGDSGFDPGGATSDLPAEAAAAPPSAAAPAVGAGDTAAVETAGADTNAAEPGDGAVTPSADAQPAPPAPDVVPPASAQPPSEASTGAPAPAEPAAPPAPLDTDAAARSAAPQREPARKRKPRRHAATEVPAHRSVTPPSTAPASVAATSAPSLPATVRATPSRPAAPSPPAAVSQGRAARPGERFHVVLGGESLWSIAGDLLGDRASVARVAREVNRLWELNRDRIATGDRDLLMVGTRLALR